MRWTLKPTPPLDEVTKLSSELSVDKTIASLLVQRNIKTYQEAKTFFRPQLEDLHDPFLMQDMAMAVERIEKAIKHNENILIYGDYDVDGTSAVSLVSSYIKTYYSNVAIYIPDRYAEGYGISYKGIDFANDNNFSLIVALDCGIKAIDKIEYASKKGIDFIICDHHRPDDELPKAVAVLDPKRKDCSYPFDELCGCGIGFKLVQGLASHRNQTIDDVKIYLDLVAIAIAADIVPIVGENRILTYYGLHQINTNPRAGIKAIINQLQKTTLTITDVVFIIAPRINAAGRMKHGTYAVELLTENNINIASTKAAEIEIFNRNRRDLDTITTQEALQQIIANKEEKNMTTVVYHKDWHKGVIGIVASRLIENYYRPTLVFTKSGDKLAASARSVKGFDIYNALHACAKHIEQFGGHKYAAGLTLLEDNYSSFKQKFEQVVKETIPKASLNQEILIDQEIELSVITPKLFRILKQFGPFGPKNMKPIFLAKKLKDAGYSKKVGADGNHLKLNLMSEDEKTKISGIGFNLGKYDTTISNGNLVDIVFTIEENHWNGTTSLQLNVKDIRLSE